MNARVAPKLSTSARDESELLPSGSGQGVFVRQKCTALSYCLITLVLAGCTSMSECRIRHAVYGAAIGSAIGGGTAVLIAAVTGPKNDPRGDEELESLPMGMAAGAAIGSALGSLTCGIEK